ncbi:MAG: hypothetical protein CME06_11465 [Gemmatimonadetes bacterium]|nr:hypothetical protein [Gemmatimonadota bacterium]
MLHTARQSFVAGLAYGLNKSLLMLSESDVLAPLDYRDLLRRYDNARNAKTELDVWLDPVEKEFARETDQAKSRAHTIRLASELKGLRFGEYIAENESRDKLDACFVPTAAYNAAIEGTTTLFVGRKGSGKSANLLRLERELAGDSRNLVCVIKPVAYEMQGLVDLLRKYEKRDSKGYAVDALWKYVLYTEIARTLRARLDKRHNSTWTDSEQWFGQYVDQQGDIILDDFSVRLENCVDLLLEGRTGEWEDKVKDTRLGISEALHVNALGGLLKALGPAMERIGRVCILIDNLDKAWERSADISVLAELILGLLGIAQRVPRDLRLGKVGGRAVEASLAVFLRSDIFDNVRRVAREPDKLLSTRLDWSDPEMLVRVLEERFMVGREDSADPRQLWDRYFCESVQGKSTREYLLSTILPRPRDLIFFTNACVSVAVNRGHGRVEPGDIEEAEKQYSQYALESVLVESTGEEIDMEGVTFAFADGEQVVSETDVTDVLSGAGVSAKEHLRVIDRLCGLTFLGPEVGDGIYNYCEDAQAYKLAQVRASSFARRSERGRRWRIHPAFCGFLEVGRESD